MTAWLLVMLLTGCGDKDGGETAGADGGTTDGGTTDGGATDGGTTDGSATDGGSTDTGEACDLSIVSLEPADDALDVPVDDNLRVELSAEDSTAALSLVDETGVAVDGWTGTIASVVLFDPSELLAGSTAFTATLSWCAGSHSWSFTTEPDLLPVDEDGDGYLYDADDSLDDEDCDDSDDAVHPDAEEDCANGIDDDCDGLVDTEDDCAWATVDEDGDGYLYDADDELDDEDCDDSDDTVHPDAAEDCDDGVDEDCDGLVDCEDADCWTSALCDELCGSGEDEDGDALVDCDDPDCWSSADCGSGTRVRSGSLSTRYHRVVGHIGWSSSHSAWSRTWTVSDLVMAMRWRTDSGTATCSWGADRLAWQNWGVDRGGGSHPSYVDASLSGSWSSGCGGLAWSAAAHFPVLTMHSSDAMSACHAILTLSYFSSNMEYECQGEAWLRGATTGYFRTVSEGTGTSYEWITDNTWTGFEVPTLETGEWVSMDLE